ncbi:hypothetical protein M1B72_14300 [Geomonas paludis]|uniref:Uncharacterized protein n=1 Tax=Geomonas paludis TaxID=2740185 RepID=A0A6V8MXP2_9BACT|nr:hypothetical protein [Geomonas paludis]UPU34615.1 hypothetical protein M1B72_14300 [Geomonas paludis]GFO64988.1 hypothetical protein GMPD_29070 [Geomonas paludis]
MTMQWHHLALGPGEISAGISTAIQDAFTALFRSAGGPRTMALFRKAAGEGGVDLYFTPECEQHAWRLLQEYGATPCAPPPLAGLELLVGHNEITYYLTT